MKEAAKEAALLFVHWEIYGWLGQHLANRKILQAFSPYRQFIYTSRSASCR